MELLQDEAYYALFRTFTRTAFHLEVQDSYHTPDEDGPFQLFLTQQVDDFAWHQPWLNLVRNVTATGKSIRWLPRHIIDAEALTADDYWLFDDNLVVFTVFEPSGRFAGGAATSDPTIVSYCRTVRDRVGAAAIPHSKYVDSEHVTT